METTNPTSSGVPSPPGKAAEGRRGFLAQALALVGGTVALLGPAAVGIVAALNPLRQKAAGGRFIRLAWLDMLPADGTPRRFPVIADRTDAWNRFPNEPIGAVYLRRAGKQKVEAVNVLCPHAGCPIQYHDGDEQDANKRDRFACPCHSAVFELTGKRISGQTSDCPRDLDTLQVKIENGTQVWVKFEDFEPGVARKVAKA